MFNPGEKKEPIFTTWHRKPKTITFFEQLARANHVLKRLVFHTDRTRLVEEVGNIVVHRDEAKPLKALLLCNRAATQCGADANYVVIHFASAVGNEPTVSR